tara:strand:- start:1737 stop:2297 length:561 start_codon:yes stop_codon:yes gene_type:complete
MLKAVVLISIFFFIVSGLNVSAEEDLYDKFGIIKPEATKPAPLFILKDLNGKEIYSNDYIGKVVFLNFWATWCMPCVVEMPAIEKLYNTFKDKGFVVLAVSIDQGGINLVKSFVKKHNLTFPILLDPNLEVMKAYNVTGIPASFLISQKGIIKGFATGAREWDNATAMELVKTLIQDIDKRILSQK